MPSQAAVVVPERFVIDNEQDIVNALINDATFNFKEKRIYLEEGVCPSCGSKEVFVSKTKPYVVKCNRRVNCGYQENTRNIYPELFSNYSELFPRSEQNPNATADVYLGHNRQFDVAKMIGW